MQVNKALISLVFGLGLVILAGLSLLAYGLYQRANNPEFKFFTPAPASDLAVSNNTISLPKGSWIKEIETTEHSIVVHITNTAKKDSLLILDAATGATRQQIEFK